MKSFKQTRRRFLSDLAGAGLVISLDNSTSSFFEQNVELAPAMFLKSDIERSRSFMLFSKQQEWITDTDMNRTLLVGSENWL